MIRKWACLALAGSAQSTRVLAARTLPKGHPLREYEEGLCNSLAGVERWWFSGKPVSAATPAAIATLAAAIQQLDKIA